MYLLYNLLLIFLSLIAFPYFLLKMFKTGKYYQSFSQKVGFFSSDLSKIPGRPKIWINAVSVGEVISANSIVDMIRDAYPSAGIVFSTVTETGQKMAHQMIKGVDAYIYFPLDFSWAVRRALKLIGPDLFITAETEIWPNFLRLAKKRGVKTMLINGRISVRSIGRYRKTRFFWSRVLKNLDVMSMILPIDRERIISMGAVPERVLVNGSSKYDKLVDRIDPIYEEEMRKILNISEDKKVFIAGSIHQEEEELVVKAYQKFREKFPELLLIVAPRYLDRTSRIERLLNENGFNGCIKKTEIDKGRRRKDELTIILDTIGELFKVYSLGTIILCGGSFILYKGGHNILEPAAWGKVVFYGPIMNDFLDAKALLEGVGAGVSVRNGDELAEKGIDFLENPEKLRLRGESAREVVLANSGVAAKSLELVRGLLSKSNS